MSGAVLPSVVAVAVALSILHLVPTPVHAQTNRQAPVVTLEEAEAHQMSLTLRASCSPRRHNSVVGSESVIERGEGPLVGTAVFYSSFEGTFIVLEEYDEELWGHCLVFSWFGGDLAPGRYRIGQLSMDTLEAELAAEDHSFFSMAAIRNPNETPVFVIESGTIELATAGQGTVTGSFDVSGFLLDGMARSGDVTWKGSFTAREAS